MERRMLEGQKLQAIGQLAAGIAHEINNPVGYILSNLETTLSYLDQLRPLLLNAPKGGVDVEFLLKDFRDAMNDCRTGAGRIRDIVRDLRGFAHPDEGVSTLADANELLRRSVRLCWNEIKYKAAVHEDFGELGLVRCRENRIEQVFINLLVNAAQAMQGKGDIYLTTRALNGVAEIRIRDTGGGISKEHRGRLFEPFFTTKPVGKGTGLGLHVAREIVVGHGGTIEVNSEPGQGAEFVVRLPIADVEPERSTSRSRDGEADA
jgi:signal transduction histidine kinase